MHSRIVDQDAYDWIVKDPTIDSPERGEFEKLSTFKMKQWYVLDAWLACGLGAARCGVPSHRCCLPEVFLVFA